MRFPFHLSVRRVATALLLVPLALGIFLTSDQTGRRPAGPDPSLPVAQASVETEQRIAFFTSRAQRDPMDFIALNRLADAYLQRARETGDVADYARANEAVKRSV